MPEHRAANPLTRRHFLKIAGLGATLASTAGLGRAAAQSAPNPSAKASLTIFDFGDANAQQVYKNAIARFNKRYPNVLVKDDYSPFPNGWGQYINNLKTRAASGLVPDVIAIAIEGVRATITQNLILPLDDFIANDPTSKEYLKDVAAPLSDALKFDGKTYYLTREWNNMCIHYNTKAFEDAGIERPKDDWTWDDFIAIAQKLTKGDAGNKNFGFGLPFFNFGLQPWFNTNGTSVLTPDWRKSNLDDPKALESVKFIHSLVHEHKVSPSVEGTGGNAIFAMFAGGKIAMTGGGHWPLGTYLANNFKTMDVQYWPRKTVGSTVFGSGGWGISKHCKNPELAWELIKDLTSLQTDQDIASVGAAIPARHSATETPAYKQWPAHPNVFYDSLQEAKPVPSPSNFAEVESIFMRHIQEIMSNAVTPEQGVEQAHHELTAAMAKLNT
ncbi:MAG: multiple sugar transport system substrate-binding protein [Verrucomicrobiota bacterium]|jgi:multiple sugar transport system substrate-binding protein|nr:multiple sugar transport system substrate-binding protein [Verrucomicrobiota bacterium]MEA3205811.1 multiple sugar transport system substrate-binding protein [Verrucomicrobiota bacterium]